MPLMTALERDGEYVAGVATEWWHIEAYEEFIRQEDGVVPWYPECHDLPRSPGQVELHSTVGHYVFKLWHRMENPYYKAFHGKRRTKKMVDMLAYLGEPDIDSEYLVVQPGDKFRMWR